MSVGQIATVTYTGAEATDTEPVTLVWSGASGPAISTVTLPPVVTFLSTKPTGSSVFEFNYKVTAPQITGSVMVLQLDGVVISSEFATLASVDITAPPGLTQLTTTSTMSSTNHSITILHTATTTQSSSPTALTSSSSPSSKTPVIVGVAFAASILGIFSLVGILVILRKRFQVTIQSTQPPSPATLDPFIVPVQTNDNLMIRELPLKQRRGIQTHSHESTDSPEGLGSSNQNVDVGQMDSEDVFTGVSMEDQPSEVATVIMAVRHEDSGWRGHSTSLHEDHAPPDYPLGVQH
ncbi:hypothetical protein BT96DRAFT_673940 [Gymnopus androsaceus JB14]|uniref:Uncharacterized protein n=1 Tax=Gymnopus androsaceus JB14 TaxID=1447944 RepID=A0A6A4HM56_9AGAR|nr:hypothetical protein BT96DRAFT_673940 [Gymnopus androsaceus JB14]